jgi:hypothetical protein
MRSKKRRKQKRKRGRKKIRKKKNLDLFHSLGVARHFFPLLLHESQKSPSSTSLKFHVMITSRKKRGHRRELVNMTTIIGPFMVLNLHIFVIAPS